MEVLSLGHAKKLFWNFFKIETNQEKKDDEYKKQTLWKAKKNWTNAKS